METKKGVSTSINKVNNDVQTEKKLKKRERHQVPVVKDTPRTEGRSMFHDSLVRSFNTPYCSKRLKNCNRRHPRHPLWPELPPRQTLPPKPQLRLRIPPGYKKINQNLSSPAPPFCLPRTNAKSSTAFRPSPANAPTASRFTSQSTRKATSAATSALPASTCSPRRWA